MEVIFKYSSDKWPITEEFTGSNIKISGKVVSHFEFRIRRTNELSKYLSSTTTQDVALTRRAIVLDVTSSSQDGNPIPVSAVIQHFQDFVTRCSSKDEDVLKKFASPQSNHVVIWAPSTIIGQLLAKQDSVPTPLATGTEITLVTDRATPYTNNIQIDRAIHDKSAYAKPNVDVMEGMEDFARRYQAFDQRRQHAIGASSANTNGDDDDDDWD